MSTAKQQLLELAKPFPDKLVSQKPAAKGRPALDYVSHSTITERLLQVIGPFDLEVKQLISNPDGTVVGALVTLSCEVDGRRVSITEAGDVEPGNAERNNNGANAKDAISDAFKRCAMRLGLGLHLWSGEAYFLDKVLARDASNPTGAPQRSDTAKRRAPRAGGRINDDEALTLEELERGIQ